MESAKAPNAQTMSILCNGGFSVNMDDEKRQHLGRSRMEKSFKPNIAEKFLEKNLQTCRNGSTPRADWPTRAARITCTIPPKYSGPTNTAHHYYYNIINLGRFRMGCSSHGKWANNKGRRFQPQHA
jgi:hypothetical protein